MKQLIYLRQAAIAAALLLCAVVSQAQRFDTSQRGFLLAQNTKTNKTEMLSACEVKDKKLKVVYYIDAFTKKRIARFYKPLSFAS